MASIKISDLKDLSKDLLTDKDVFIVNDENLTTMSIKYGTIVEKIQETDHLFTGDIEFSGSVTVSGVLANRNFYTKTEVDTIVADGDAAVMVDVNKNKLDVESLRNLSGVQRSVQGIIPSTYIGGTFICEVVPEFSAGALNIVQAVNAIGSQLEDQSGNIATNAAGVTSNGVLIQENADKNDEQDIAILELQTAVGTPSKIDANGNLILGNTDNIATLAGVVGVAVGDQNMGAMNATYLTDNSNVKNNLKELNSQAVAEAARVDNVILDLTNTDAAVVTDAARLEKLINLIVNVGTLLPNGATGKEFAEALNIEIASQLNP